MSEPKKIELYLANFAMQLYVGESFWNSDKAPEVSFLDVSEEVQERFLYLASHVIGISDNELSAVDVKRLENAIELMKARHARQEPMGGIE